MGSLGFRLPKGFIVLKFKNLWTSAISVLIKTYGTGWDNLDNIEGGDYRVEY